jgi:(p)ppGpp synthase/HD superfamily hydrolase
LSVEGDEMLGTNLSRAVMLAAAAHDNQLDKRGVPYILHPTRVMIVAEQLGLDDEALQIAVLHDTIEDTDLTLRDLRKAHFSDRVIEGVDALTRRNKKNAVNGVDETYKQFVHRAAKNADARKIKMIDNADNMRPERYVEGNSLPTRYHKALDTLISANILAGDEDFVNKFAKFVTWI